MKKQKCYLKIYLNNNLGDDLFAKIISERYPNTEFITVSYENQRSRFKNIKVVRGIVFRIINKILKIVTNKKVTIEKILVKKYKKALLLGGSVFIEGKSGHHEELGEAEEYYIIGSNFGPYNTNKYFEKCKQIFKKAQYVCFRDTESYNLFKCIKSDNIKVASDIVFSLDTSNIKITDNKIAIISIIDCLRKIGKEYQEKYEEKIIELTKFLIDKGYKIVYMSFCKKENDEIAINRILENLDETTKEKIDTYFYNGNIEEALNVLGNSRIIIGSRFHANILGLILNKTVIPVIYSDKTTNVLKDIDFKGKVIDIKNLDDFNINNLEDKDLEYKLDVSKQKQNSNIHFEKLDKILK